MLRIVKIVLIILPLAAIISFCAPQNTEPVTILRDTDFKNGFGIGDYFIQGKNESGDIIYRDIKPYKLKRIPDYDNAQVWKFQEGVHRNFTDAFGEFVEELYEHRFNVSGQLIVDSPDRLYAVIYNNYKIDTNHPLYNKRLVRSIDSDRKGKINMYFNTQNLIRNEATTHESGFKNDTWPHYLIYQNIDSLDMAEVDSMPVSFTVKLNHHKKLSDRMAGGRVPEKANFLSYFRVTNKKTGKSLWLGICMYTSCGQQLFYNELMSVDQHGTGMYRFPVDEYGGPLIPGEEKTYSFDLKKILERALDNPKSREGEVSYANYKLVGYNIGWECIGDHETEIEVSGLSAFAY